MKSFSNQLKAQPQAVGLTASAPTSCSKAFNSSAPAKALLVALSITLTACGGGSTAPAPSPSPTPSGTPAPSGTPSASGSPVPAPAPAGSPSPTPTPTPAPTPAPAPAPAPAADVTCGIPNFQAALLTNLNAVRTSGAVCGGVAYAATGALNWDGQLQNAASAHSTDMATNNFFSHQSPTNGTTMRQRVTAAGYNWSNVGENIAAGQTSVAQVMSDWVNSPGHCSNMMNPAFKDLGVSCIKNSASTYQYYWTMELGKRQ